MDNLFNVKDRRGKVTKLTKERWQHITSPTSPHAYMTNHLEEVKETLIAPDKIIESVYDDSKFHFYKYYKNRKQYLRGIVKYLKANGLVVTSYFVKNIS